MDAKKLYRKSSPSMRQNTKLKVGFEDFFGKNNFRNFGNRWKTPEKNKNTIIETFSKSFDPYLGRPKTNKSRGNNTPWNASRLKSDKLINI